MGFYTKFASSIFSTAEPDITDLEIHLTETEQAVSALVASGGKVYATKAEIDADLAHDAYTGAWVVADSTAANNGIYQKQGASGTGSWVKRGELPIRSFVIATNAGAGTANAIQVTTTFPAGEGDLIGVPIVVTNTGSPVTVSINGGPDLTFKTISNNDVAPGGLVASSLLLGTPSGSNFRLLSDQASAAIQTAAEAAQVAAEAARDAALAAVPQLRVDNYTALRALTRAASSASTALLISAGASFGIGGGAFALDSSDTTSTDNAMTCIVDADGGRWKRVGFDGRELNIDWHEDTVANGVGSDRSAIVAAAALIPSGGGTLVFPRKDYLIDGSIVELSMNSGGASGWGVRLVGRHRGGTTIKVDTGANAYAFGFYGPSGTWHSYFEHTGIRFASVVANECRAVKIGGHTECRIDVTGFQMNRVLDMDSVLRSWIDISAYQCTVGARQRLSGALAGAWGASGNNTNDWKVQFSQCVQWGMIWEGCQAGRIRGHVERCGTENIAGGGVHDTDRGGIKIVDPEGAVSLQISSEDCGDVEDGDEGFGPVCIVTTAANAGIVASVSLFGWNIKRTLDGPKSALYAFLNGGAGKVAIGCFGCVLKNISGYVTSASNPIFKLGISSANCALTVVGGQWDGGTTEMQWDKTYCDYSIVNAPELTPGGKYPEFHKLAGKPSNWVTADASNSALTVTNGAASEQTLVSIDIQGMMGDGGDCEVKTTWSCTNNSNAKTGRVKLHTSTFSTLNLASVAGERRSNEFGNTGSVSSQLAGPGGVAGGYGTGATVTMGVDTDSANAVINITGERADAGDTLQLRRYEVRVRYG